MNSGSRDRELAALDSALAAAAPALSVEEQRLAAQFSSASSAAGWQAAIPATFVIRFDDGLQLARRHTARVRGAAVPETARRR
jgi:hypothetical protein